MKPRFFLALTAFLFAADASAATVQLNATVPSSGTPFDFDSDGTNNWPLVRCWDGTTKCTLNSSDGGLVVHVANANANGQQSANNSSPVVLPPTQVTTDPCALNTKINVPLSTTAGRYQIVAPVALKRVYICSIVIKSTAADSISLVGGLGSSCTTGSPLAIVGSTTPANGVDVGALDGWSQGNGGGTIYSTTTAGHGVCLVQSGTTKIAGALTYVQQ